MAERVVNVCGFQLSFITRIFLALKLGNNQCMAIYSVPNISAYVLNDGLHSKQTLLTSVAYYRPSDVRHHFFRATRVVSYQGYSFRSIFNDLF